MTFAFVLRAWPAALVGLLSACSQSVASDAVPFFQEVSAAPAPVRNAAAAIVRIQIAGSFGTGSFISPDGLLLTNNHVLGVDVCPIEGCFAKISWSFQRGAPLQDPQNVYFVPKAIDVGLDMAVLQAHDSDPTGAPLATPQFLTIDARESSVLLGTHVNVVGHPEGALKKWSPGLVVNSDGAWIWSTAFTLPGNSGSPILDDHGHLVGLLHRGAIDANLIVGGQVDTYSIGSSSAALVSALSAPLPAAMWSTATPASDDAVLRHEFAYLTARSPNAYVGGWPEPVLTVLGAACDAGLARQDYASPEDLASALAPCLKAERWIECRTDAMASFGICPDRGDSAAWLARFQAVFDHWHRFNGQLSLDEASFAPASLSSSMASGQQVGAQGLQQALAAANPPLNPKIANYLAAFNIASYQGSSIVNFVRGYSRIPDYALSGQQIVSAALWLNHNQALSGNETLALLAALAKDGAIDVATKLGIEQVRYRSGAL